MNYDKYAGSGFGNSTRPPETVGVNPAAFVWARSGLRRRRVRAFAPRNRPVLSGQEMPRFSSLPAGFRLVSAVPVHGCNNQHFVTEFLNQIIEGKVTYVSESGPVSES